MRGELDLFRACYTARAVGLGGLRFERTALPVDGGAAGQPAKTLDLLDHLAHVANDLLAERLKKSHG